MFIILFDLGYGLLSNSNYENAFPGLRKCYLIKEQFHYSCKKMKQRYNSRSKFQCLVEVQALKRLSGHPSVVQLRQVLYATETGSAWIITELIEINLDQLIKVGFSNQLSKDKITSYVWQLLKAVEYMHSNDIFHDNIKPENILVKGSVVKLTGFEFSRSSYSPLPYLDRPSCLWYRAPECLLTSGYYTCKVDEWSIGCIMFEMITSRRLFFGINEGDQITKIHNILGTPADDVLTKFKEYANYLIIFFYLVRRY
ncbi:uncharacterized protein TRIADDRAFT_32222 [Trichoplax adhaerens]|uniref:Protein kinase domain-containing protein n=1 Tax=Trichoplax adhaerens TaxID=10228 RepID=B3SAE6_TRIAD|nr:hypothetical protein TRIADDRAFT_32222 [Trichoplax adhaerens]EDV20299.1 hypothetical protein TRIADDRAFT_32222 [Trichoplax adhaerens]|eukprot:XP_002117249.1 hypothetical protein TRIADDRAFT_32222 [Trichoplax adhaerens]